MEFILCLLLAALLSGGRIGADIVHAAKGTTPPHLEKARLKAQRQADRTTVAAGKPRLRDVVSVYWGDAMADLITSHNRRRAEKSGQRRENDAAQAQGREPRKLRPSLKDRAKRIGRLLWEPVGEAKSDVTALDDQAPSVAPETKQEGTAPTMNDRERREERDRLIAAINDAYGRGDWQGAADALESLKARYPAAVNDRNLRVIASDGEGGSRQLLLGDLQGDIRRRLREGSTSTQGATMTQPNATTAPATPATGEAVNYETAVAQLDQLADAQQTHLDKALAALASIRDAKQHIADTQVTYQPAASAAASTHEHLGALNLDQETLSSTGTMADAMPINQVDTMLAQLEEMEATAQQQVANAEAALAATAAARQTIVAKYGDAHTTVAGELSGDSRFLSNSGA